MQDIAMALTDNLVTVWNMDANWEDSWGVNDGIASGATFDFIEAIIGSSGTFDGLDDQVTIDDPIDGSLDPGIGAFSISGFIYFNTFQTGVYVCLSKNDTVLPALKGFRMIKTGINTIEFIFGNGIDQKSHESGILNVKTWYHFAWTRNDFGNAEFYINSNPTQSRINSDYNLSTSADFLLGYDKEGSRFADIKLDLIHIWNKELTSEDVAEDYNNGDGVYFGKVRIKNGDELSLKKITLQRRILSDNKKIVESITQNKRIEL